LAFLLYFESPPRERFCQEILHDHPRHIPSLHFPLLIMTQTQVMTMF